MWNHLCLYLESWYFLLLLEHNWVFQGLPWIFVSVLTPALLCIPLPPSHVLDNWEKCALTPQSSPVTLSGPGQDCGTFAPWSWTIWFEGGDFQSWVMDQWSATSVAFSALFFLALMGSVDEGAGGWEKKKYWPTNKKRDSTRVWSCCRKKEKKTPLHTAYAVDITSH